MYINTGYVSGHFSQIAPGQDLVGILLPVFLDNDYNTVYKPGHVIMSLAASIVCVAMILMKNETGSKIPTSSVLAVCPGVHKHIN